VPLELTYLGCEGVLVRGRAGSVLIDGLFSDEAAPFGMPDAGALDAIRRARPPFDAVDAILTTHHHGDHFDAAAVATHLGANSRAVFVSTAQAADELRAADGGAFAGRIHALDAAEGVVHGVDVGRIRVDGFGLSHGKVHYGDVEHLGFLVTLDGRRLLHLGDGIIAEKSLRSAGVIDGAIDIGVVPFWFLTYPFGRQLAERGFRPRVCFAVHIRISERERVVREVEAWPNAVALTEPLARFDVADDGTVTRKE
jgi:L-ascorbate metabolism protein UlaG (beta-lactamase superfamily)